MRSGESVIDAVDKKILSLLQEDSTLSLNDISEAVNLTTTPCWKRLKRLEENGIIEKRVALLNPEKLDLAFTAFVLVKTSNHSHEWYG
ncbi:Lrp/AsnC family transcriptional regulator, partial [Vibrio crassostreae]